MNDFSENLDAIKPITLNDGLKTLYNELVKSDFEEWAIPGIKTIIQFSFHLFSTGLNTISNETSKIIWNYN